MTHPVPDCEFVPQYLTAREADQLWQVFQQELPWRQEQIRLFGRWVWQPRSQVWMGDPDARYRYSGQDFDPTPWHPTMKALAERLSESLGTGFNSVLCNHYEHGQHSMGWHSDNESELGDRPVIASLSLGTGRRFILRRKKDKTNRHEWLLGHGDLFVMRGDTQKVWDHSIPKTAKPVGPRINLTFRRVIVPN